MATDASETLCTGRKAQVVDKEKIGIVEVQIKKPTGTEVVVKVTRSGVCHSDVHAFEHSSVYAFYPYPQSPGHEIMGKVFAKGADVSEELKDGADVLVYPWIRCGDCDRCKKGLYNWCAETGPKANRIIGGASDGEGGFSEYVTVPGPEFLVDASGIEPTLATILPCCGLTAYNAVKKSQECKEATSDGVIVIIGCGGLGLMGIQWAKIITKQTVVAVDIDDDALATAKEYGADHTINSKTTEKVDEAIAALDGVANTRVEAVIDFVNNVHTHKLADGLLKTGATLCVVGIAGGQADTNLLMFPLRGIRVQGIFVGSLPELEEICALSRDGDVKTIVSKTLKFEEVQTALEDLQAGKVRGRQVLEVSDL